MDPKLPTINDVLAMPYTSHWMLRAMNGALARDPVDALNDAELLYLLLKRRCQTILGGESNA